MPENDPQENPFASDHEEARQELADFEKSDELPTNPSDWPDGKAKFQTFANDDDRAFGDGPTSKLGPGSLNHEPDGSVTIDGEPVDNPDDYKGEPIPGGPTDPNTPELRGEVKRREKLERQEQAKQ